jgi:hypothetical protein
MKKSKTNSAPQYVVIQHERILTEVDLNPDYRPCHIPTPANATLGKIFLGTSEGDAIEKWREANKPPPALPTPAPPPKPETCPSIFSPDQFPKARPDASEVVKNAGELRSLVTQNFLHFHPKQILDGLGFTDQDLVEVVLPGHGPAVKHFNAIRGDLDRGCFSAINPNPLVIGSDAPRKFLVVKFSEGVNLTAQGKRIGFLRRFGHLSALILNSQKLNLESWFFTGDLSKSKLEKLFTKAVEVGADPRCGLRNFRAVVPGSPCISGQSVFKTLYDLKLVTDADHLGRVGMRQFCLHLDPPNASKK